MKTAAAPAVDDVIVVSRTRALDYVELAKPRVAVLVLFTVAAGTVLAARGAVDTRVLLHTVLGTALVAAGASALNQVLERHRDARMRRTENRPLPSGRVQPVQALFLGVILALVGELELWLGLRHPTAAWIAGLTFFSYVFVYTPLKPKTPLNTLVGAVPGAMPPLIGWVAVRGSIELEALTLFAVVFLWQVPHFLAIAWIYRRDYAHGGFRMLPVVDSRGVLTANLMLIYCLTLLAVSLLPFFQGNAGPVYLGGVLLLGTGFLASAWRFACNVSDGCARRVLRTSLVYLPALFALLLVDGWIATLTR